jgi:hypothetical protein
MEKIEPITNSVRKNRNTLKGAKVSIRGVKKKRGRPKKKSSYHPSM